MQIINLVPDLRPTILAARELRDARNTLARFLPNRQVNAINYRLGRRKRLDQTVPIRATDAPATPIRRPGLVDIQGGLPNLTPIIDLSEQDLTDELFIAQQLAGMSINWQDPVDAAAGIAALTIENTFEIMRGQVLTTGVVALEAADGIVHDVDFEIPSDNKIALNTPLDPTHPADVFSALKEGHDAYIESSGDLAGVMLTTTSVWNLLIAALQNYYPQQPIGEDQLRAYLAQQKLPTVFTNDRKLEDATGARTRVYPEGFLTFLPGLDQPVGETQLGITQESVQQVARGVLRSNEAAGITVETLGNDNPVQRAVKAAAKGLPILRDNVDIVVMSGLVAH